MPQKFQVVKFPQLTVTAGKLVCISWMTLSISVWLRLCFGRMTNWWGFTRKNINSSPRTSDLSLNIQTQATRTQFTMRNCSRKRWTRCEKAKSLRKNKMRRGLGRWLNATFENLPLCNIWIKIKIQFHLKQVHKGTVAWMILSWRIVNQLFLI